MHVCCMYADIIIISTTSTKTHTCCRHATTIPIERQRGVFIHESQTGTPNDNNSIRKSKTNERTKARHEGLSIEPFYGRRNHFQFEHFFELFFLRSIENWPRTLISFVLYASVCCCCCWCFFISFCSSRRAVVSKLYQRVPFIST